MRDNAWLHNRLEYIWQTYFADVEKANEIKITFGRKAYTRLGSIKQVRGKAYGGRTISQPLAPNPSLITITGYFADESIPKFIVDLVIAHELAHYAHGFCSPLPQLYKNPHEGKIIDKELYKRGFGEEIKKQKIWLKEEWPRYIKNNQSPRNNNQKKIKQHKSTIWNLFIGN